MTFNPEKGPYLEDKSVVGKFQIEFNKDSKILQFEKIKLAVDKQPFVFTGKFYLAEVPTPFLLSWKPINCHSEKQLPSWQLTSVSNWTLTIFQKTLHI